MMGSASRLRRSVPIRGFVGANGSGKSLTAAGDLRPSLEIGRPVMSAVRLLDWTKGPGDECVNPLCDVLGHGVPGSGHVPSHPAWIPLRHLVQLLEFEGGDIFLDEVGALVSSRESASMPVQIATLLQQLRKRDLTLTWTAPAWARADKILREVTQLATVCHGFGTRRVPDRMWTQRRYIHAVSYHAADLDDFEIARTAGTSNSANKPRKQCSEWYRVRGSSGASAYDTFEEVPSIGFSSLSGVCVQCGGRRSAPRCSCADHGEAPAGRAPSVVPLSSVKVLPQGPGVAGPVGGVMPGLRVPADTGSVVPARTAKRG
jgi:hypothetical protein